MNLVNYKKEIYLLFFLFLCVLNQFMEVLEFLCEIKERNKQRYLKRIVNVKYNGYSVCCYCDFDKNFKENFDIN